MNHSDFQIRVKEELKRAGITKYGLLKSESRYLPKIMHEDEHIGGVVYGQYGGGSAMLIATDHRVIFLDRKPLFTTTDELTYDIVSGVKHDSAGILNTVVLHTRIADYTIRYANGKCANQFVKYIESRRLERDYSKRNSDQQDALPGVVQPVPFLDNASLIFLKEHDLAVLSSVDRTGNVYGAAVYYLVDQLNHVYILTKQGTAKARNILAHNQVALTIFEPSTAKTLNIQGIAEFETNQKKKDYVFSEIVKPRLYDGEMRPPPVIHLKEGAFTVLRITPVSSKYTDYKQLSN